MNHRIHMTAAAALAATAATVIALGAPAHAAERVRPVNEGNDTQKCVTYAEVEAVLVGMPRRRAERIMDTKGHRVRRHALDYIADLVGASQTPMRYREVRTYPVCDQPELFSYGGTMLVEYSTRTPRERARLVFYE